MTPLPMVILFVRLPVPGQVKTRLAAETSPAQAANLYRIMAEIIAERLMARAEVGYQLVLYFTPSGAEQQIAEWLLPDGRPAGVEFQPQPAGNLTERLEAAGELARSRNSPAVLLLGSDCPHVTCDEIVQAIGLARDAGAAMGRATDGGFWTLALRDCPAGLFEQVEYSSPDTADQLLARMTSFGIRTEFLAEKTDVDRLRDIGQIPVEMAAEIKRRAASLRVDIPPILPEK